MVSLSDPELETLTARTQLAAFLTLHITNFCTTLTPASALARHQKHALRTNVDLNGPPAPRVDFTAPGVSTVLAALAEAESSATDASVFVKIAPPVNVHIIPATPSAHPTASVSSILSATTEAQNANTGEVIENFMSSWTTLVGDPFMSKWIVVILGLSVALNGFLLKGIAAGSGLPVVRGSVRFRSRARVSDKAEEEVSEPIKPVVAVPSVGPVLAPPAPAPVPEPVAAPPVVTAPVKSKPQVLSIPVDLNTVDAKLERERLHAEALARAERARNEPVRSLDEIIDIFENGPRPVSASLSLLTDEEVIILAQNGKIAAYALEKMLGDFERAVTIRRALICT